MSTGDLGVFNASAPHADGTYTPPTSGPTRGPTRGPNADAPQAGATTFGNHHGAGVLQPPVAYLPCRLDDNGDLADVMMVELQDGRIALLGYTALDRFVAACGDAHPWVLWQTSELDRLRDLKPFDVAYLDVPLPAAMRVDAAQEAPR